MACRPLQRLAAPDSRGRFCTSFVPNIAFVSRSFEDPSAPSCSKRHGMIGETFALAFAANCMPGAGEKRLCESSPRQHAVSGSATLARTGPREILSSSRTFPIDRLAHVPRDIDGDKMPRTFGGPLQNRYKRSAARSRLPPGGNCSAVNLG